KRTKCSRKYFFGIDIYIVVGVFISLSVYLHRCRWCSVDTSLHPLYSLLYFHRFRWYSVDMSLYTLFASLSVVIVFPSLSNFHRLYSLIFIVVVFASFISIVVGCVACIRVAILGVKSLKYLHNLFPSLSVVMTAHEPPSFECIPVEFPSLSIFHRCRVAISIVVGLFTSLSVVLHGHEPPSLECSYCIPVEFPSFISLVYFHRCWLCCLEMNLHPYSVVPLSVVLRGHEPPSFECTS
ncbi:hypothetical protein L9F63_009974, partial [Diploptera punctata]